MALATDVMTAAAAAISGGMDRFAVKAAAVAVVLALLTRPPSRLKVRNPMLPK